MNTHTPRFPAFYLLGTLLWVAALGAFGAETQAPRGPARWEKDIRAFEEADRTNPPPTNAVLFIGSSSIRLWKTLARDFPDFPVVNRGFGGSEIADSVEFAGRIVVPYGPRMIVMYAGGNDLNAGTSPEQVFTDFKGFVSKVRASLPNVRIAYISIAPNPARWAQVDKVRAANRLIEEFCRAGPQLAFINVFPHMLGEDGQPRPEIFVQDRLHMNAKGYELWTRIVRPFLAEASGGGAESGSGLRHRFACTDYSQGKVFIVSSNSTVEWEYRAPSCNDLWVLPNGNLLFNTGHGVKEVTTAKQVVFSYESKSEIYACQRLSNGLTFIGECNTGRLLEVAPDGKIQKEVRLLPEGQDGGHLFMRNARRLPGGHYLVAHYGAQVVKEHDPQGKVVKEFAAPGGPHSVVRLPNGHTLIAVGDMVKEGNKVFEVDADGRTVWSVGADELPGISLKFMAGLQRLPNGNTVMSNWLGHGQLGKAPHLIEVTPDKRVVWTFADHQTMKTVSSVQILDDGGAGTEARVWH
jgi:lysophospholipase L1-like esterase